MPPARVLAVALLVGAASPAAVRDAAAQSSFTVVALPDTQNYSNSAANAPLFTQQTQWIADQIQLEGNPRNIEFVTHLGDVVSNGDNLTETNRADASLDVLDGVIDYSVLPGNHDYATTGNKGTGTDLYVEFFGPDRFAGAPFFGGADPSGNNTYQTFSAGGTDFLHLALEWRPTVNEPFRDPSPIDWAQSILDANPSTPVILSTHEYLDDEPAGRSAAGEALWNQLVRGNDQIFLVLGGHYHSVGGTNDGEYHQASLNDAGRPVFEVLQDYQDYPNGGDGWLRLIEFDLPNDRLEFETYSPVLDAFQTETVAEVGQFASRFGFNVDYDSRLTPVFIPKPREPNLVIRQGAAGYAGALDKEIRSSGGDAANGQAASISVDGDDGSPGDLPNQGLLRFDGLVGAGAGQLPAGAVIESARLVLEVSNPGSGFAVHELLVDWDESSVWTDFGAGVQEDGVEAAAVAVATLGANNSSENVAAGTLEIDVTSSLQAILDGTLTNRGWALLPFVAGTNGVDFFTSEAALVAQRPALEIFLVPGDYNLDGFVDDLDRQAWAAAYGTVGPSFADGNGDGVVDAADYAFWRDAAQAVAAIPEPAATPLAAIVLLARSARRRSA